MDQIQNPAPAKNAATAKSQEPPLEPKRQSSILFNWSSVL